MMLDKLNSILAPNSNFQTNSTHHFRNDLFDFEIHSIKFPGVDFQLLVTKGLSNYLQPVSEKNKRFERIELYMCLPEYWDFNQSKWPIEWLNKLAEIPQKNKTWFGPGDTIPAGNPTQPIDEKLKADYFILSTPILLSTELTPEKLIPSSFTMLAIIPIFKKEFDFKMQFSATKLFERFATKNVTELIDVYREPVGRKKFMGLI